MAEERFGIKTDPGDVERLHMHLLNTYGAGNAIPPLEAKSRYFPSDILKKVFLSGEAAGFLTVNETYFFREPAHFSFLFNLLPSFEKTGLRICCAAVSTGCEAYSIAMMIESFNRSIEKPLSYHIDAFDINPKVIDTACQGVYSERALREDGSCFRYMAEPYLNIISNSMAGGYRIDPVLKKNINFFVHNLMDELPPKVYDIIFFRNAFIYFSPQNRERVLSNLSVVLKDGGILILGVSETAGAKHPALEGKNQKDDFYFQKPLKCSIMGAKQEEKCSFLS
jgi:chemotaxis protein methyltransferase CheR